MQQRLRTLNPEIPMDIRPDRPHQVCTARSMILNIQVVVPNTAPQPRLRSCHTAPNTCVTTLCRADARGRGPCLMLALTNGGLRVGAPTCCNAVLAVNEALRCWGRLLTLNDGIAGSAPAAALGRAVGSTEFGPEAPVADETSSGREFYAQQA